MYGFDIRPALVFVAIVSMLMFWGGVKAYNWIFVDDAIKTEIPIVPEIELVIKNNQVDTLYVYRKP